MMTNKKLKHGGFMMAHRGGEAGQAMIEFALVMPLFTLLFIGAGELAQVAYAAIEVTNAAEAAAQYASQSRAAAADTTTMTSIAQNDASLFLTNLSVTATTSCVCSDGTASTCLTSDCSGSSSHIEAVVTVNTQATYTANFRLPLLPTTFTLKGKAVQKILEQ